MVKKHKYSIRKYSIGAASVLIGAFIYLGVSSTELHAEEIDTPMTSEASNIQTDNGTEVVQEGKTGTRTTTTTYTMKEDGTVVKNTPTVDTEDKVDQIIKIGTKENTVVTEEKVVEPKETTTPMSLSVAPTISDSTNTGVETMSSLFTVTGVGSLLGMIRLRKRKDEE